MFFDWLFDADLNSPVYKPRILPKQDKYELVLYNGCYSIEKNGVFAKFILSEGEGESDEDYKQRAFDEFNQYLKEQKKNLPFKQVMKTRYL